MNICVTGGAGFIGSHLTDRLIDMGHTVLVVDNLTTGCREFVNPKAEFVEMDIRSQELIDLFKRFKPDYVFHEAAQTMVPVSMKNPRLDCDVNLMGLINVLEACLVAKVKKILMPSSAAVYGDLDTLPLTEEMQGHPSSFYGLTKLTTESYLKLYYEAFGLPYQCFRYSNVYGPRQGHGGEGGVISIFCEHLIHGKNLTVFGDGEQTRDFIYVGDVVHAIRGLLETPSARDDVFNVANGKQTTLNQVAKELEKLTGKTLHATHKAPRLGDIRDSYAQTDKLDQFDFMTHTPLAQGLAKYVASVQ